MSHIVKSEQITYGQDYPLKVQAFLGGEKIRFDTPVIDSCIYLKPAYKTYLLPSRRVVKKVDNVFCDILELFSSVEDYEKHKAVYWSKFADPETGRLNS